MKKHLLGVLALLVLGQAAWAQAELPGSDPDCPCGTGCQFWGRAEGLFLWTPGSRLPPLVTTSPTGTPRNQAGILGQNTTVVVGNERVDDNMRSGGRAILGWWFDSCVPLGVEASFFVLGSVDTRFDRSSNGDPILARPFFDASAGNNDAQLVAFPNVLTGSIHIASSSRVYGAAFALRENVFCGGGALRIDGICGYRFLNLRETLGINEDLVSIDPAGLVPVGTTIKVNDNFRTDNSFHGADIGFAAEYRNGPLFVESVLKMAIGGVFRTVDINGSTVTQTPGGIAVANPGGLLAAQTNIGHYRGSEVSIVPEFDLTARWALRPGIVLSVGYMFMIWTDVAHPSDQIDTAVNRTIIPPVTNFAGPVRPAFSLTSTDVWVQGINVGLEFRY